MQLGTFINMHLVNINTQFSRAEFQGWNCYVVVDVYLPQQIWPLSHQLFLTERIGIRNWFNRCQGTTAAKGLAEQHRESCFTPRAKGTKGRNVCGGEGGSGDRIRTQNIEEKALPCPLKGHLLTGFLPGDAMKLILKMPNIFLRAGNKCTNCC